MQRGISGGLLCLPQPQRGHAYDWDDEQRRILHYQELGKPLKAQIFVHSLKERLITALAQFNRVLPQLRHLIFVVRVGHPAVDRAWKPKSDYFRNEELRASKRMLSHQSHLIADCLADQFDHNRVGRIYAMIRSDVGWI